VASDVTADVFIGAEPLEVFDYFTDAELMTTWMGELADLDPVVGGKFAVDVSGTAVRGRYLRIEPPSRLVISWGFEGSEVLPPEGSTLEVTLAPEHGGTRVTICHRLLPTVLRGSHASGWRRYLAALAGRFETTDR